MIKTFAGKGLRLFFETGSAAGIQAKHTVRLQNILFNLDSAADVRDMGLPGYNLHPLKGNLRDLWAVKVSGNWRVTFRFQDGHAYVVDYMDYH